MNLLIWIRAQWDRAAAVVAFSIGGLFLIVGWVRVGQEALTAAQVPYILSGGLGGIALIGVGAVAWISGDLRDEWRKLDDIERAIVRLGSNREAPEPDASVGEAEATASNGVSPATKPRRQKSSPTRTKALAGARRDG